MSSAYLRLLIGLPEFTQDWGNSIEGHKQNIVHTRTQEKEAVTPQKTDPDLLRHPGISSRSMGQQWIAAGSEAVNAAVPAWDLLKEVAIIFITSTIVWPQVKQQGGSTAPPFNRKLY